MFSYHIYLYYLYSCLQATATAATAAPAEAPEVAPAAADAPAEATAEQTEATEQAAADHGDVAVATEEAVPAQEEAAAEKPEGETAVEGGEVAAVAAAEEAEDTTTGAAEEGQEVALNADNAAPSRRGSVSGGDDSSHIVSGVLRKMGKGLTGYKNRFVVLDNGNLSFYTDESAYVDSDGAARIKGRILKLSAYRVVPDPKDSKNLTLLLQPVNAAETGAGDREWQLQSLTAEICKEWVDAFAAAGCVDGRDAPVREEGVPAA